MCTDVRFCVNVVTFQSTTMLSRSRPRRSLLGSLCVTTHTLLSSLHFICIYTFTTSPYSEYFSIKSRLLKNHLILSFKQLFGRYQHLVEKYTVSREHLTIYGIRLTIVTLFCHTTSVSRRLHIFCIMFKIIAFSIIKLFTWLYMRGGILLTCRKHVHDRIISLGIFLFLIILIILQER